MLSPNNLKTINDCLHYAEERFLTANIYFGHGTDNAWDEGVVLVFHVLQLDLDSDASIVLELVTEEQKTAIVQLIEKRIETKLPAPYLTNEAWFCTLPFYVDQRVIIPRSPIAELILQQFQPWMKAKKVKRILDLCTGSACIAIACAYAFPDAQIDASDLSEEALAVAKMNIEKHDLQDRVHLIKSDLFAAIEPQQQYDIIVTNPPYVDAADINSMPDEYHYEPAISLASGKDGLDCARTILKKSAEYLSDHGILVLEVGNSWEALEEAYPAFPFMWLEFENGGHGVCLLRKKELKELK